MAYANGMRPPRLLPALLALGALLGPARAQRPWDDVRQPWNEAQQHWSDPWSVRTYGAWRGPSREWLSLSFGLLDRAQEAGDAIEDAPLFALDLGLELSGGDWRPAFELGLAYSPHEVDLPGAPTLDLWRAQLGARLSYSGFARWRPYARGGVFWRWNSDAEYEDEPLDQTGSGGWVGAGLDWLLEPGLTLGPSWTFWRGTGQDGLEEHFLGLSASFRL